MTFWCSTALIAGRAIAAVRIEAGTDGRIDRIETGVQARHDDVILGTVIPGMGNAHSHAFHRALRGRTHAEGGDFWRWRERMYATAAALEPENYYELARAVFAEMLVSGWTAVGEFHYVHHRKDGTPYPAAHTMEHAIAAAAKDAGIRLTLLDTSYLSGGIGMPLSAAQRRFGDGSPEAWLERWHTVRASLNDETVTVGAAFHSVRGVSPEAMTTILAGLPADVPLHIHLSEQQQENRDSLERYGLTPTGLLASLGALSPRLSVVHATHLTDHDVELLGSAGVTVVMCPTTEADLGDGIGPARRLHDAGARIALGSDQNAVVDPFLEARGLEAGERLAAQLRGRFSPSELLRAAGPNGYSALGLKGGIAVGAWCDLVEVDPASRRTIGSDPEQLLLTATADDVRTAIVGGAVVAREGRLVSGNKNRDPAELLRASIRTLDATMDNPKPLLAEDRLTRPWRNGAGSTSDVLSYPADAAIDAFDWRISIATIEIDSDFSRFDGVQRYLMPLSSGGLTLHADDEQIHVASRTTYEFRGESRVRASDVREPSFDLNLMVRRGAASGSLTTAQLNDDTIVSAPNGQTIVAVVLDGTLTTGAGGAVRLGALDAIAISGGSRLWLAGDAVVALARVTTVAAPS